MQTKPQRDVVAAETVPSPRVVAAVLAIGLGLLSAGFAHACTVPFTITVAPVAPFNQDIQCLGPWGRESAVRLVEAGEGPQFFYCADQTIFSMWGRWECSIFTCDIFGCDTAADIHFCIESTGPAAVDLTWDGSSTLAVNANDTCKGIETAGFLGHTGNPAHGDRDVYDFAGRPGESVRVRLDRDGTGGGTGEAATLKVESKSGAALAQKTGKLPITLDVTLADAGIALSAVSAEGGPGDPYRGGYVLSVRPGSGKAEERLLRPRPNVEP